MIYFISTAVTAVLFVCLLLLLAAKPRISKKITVGAMTFAGISGLLIYSYGYMALTGNLPLAVLKALVAVCGSFVGGNEYSAISSVPLMQTVWVQILCTLVRICALYTTASAVITSLGTEALKKVRLWLSRRGRLHIIYGVHDDALEFGKELVGKKAGTVVFVTEKPAPTAAAAVSAMGCVLQAGPHALAADRKFLRSIGFRGGKRQLSLYALSRRPDDNLRYARKLLQTLQEFQVPAERLRLAAVGREEALSTLQQSPNAYGYGFVTVVNEAQMAARLLTLRYPPCEQLSFDTCGKAKEDFEALVIGFGRMGQAVLKSLVMNGQFEGSRFRLAVFATDCKHNDGQFFHRFPSLCREYDISFYEHDARSSQMYEYLNTRGGALRYVVICTGDDRLNEELAEDLTAYFAHREQNIPVYQCSCGGVVAYAADGTVAAVHRLYHSSVLTSDQLDEMAMLLNYRYQAAPDKTPMEQWMACDYFSRQSCRASADFVPAMLRAAGKTRQQVLAGDWNLTAEQMENLSRTEHLRWCAFHYCMGYSPMTEAEFEERSAIYRRELAENGKAAIRIGKNPKGHTHACLIAWEELEKLSRREAAVTGKAVDYKAMDAENVAAVPQLLQADPL